VRATDNRYRGERARFELAMRMIRHEARTGTIRYFTGLSDDRIRKLYTSYFKFDEGAPVKRRRGKSPTQIAPLIQTPERTLESGVFVSLLRANGLISVEDPPGPTLKGSVDLGHRFCQCYETHLLVRSCAVVRMGMELTVGHPPRRRAGDYALRGLLDELYLRSTGTAP